MILKLNFIDDLQFEAATIIVRKTLGWETWITICSSRDTIVFNNEILGQAFINRNFTFKDEDGYNIYINAFAREYIVELKDVELVKESDETSFNKKLLKAWVDKITKKQEQPN